MEGTNSTIARSCAVTAPQSLNRQRRYGPYVDAIFRKMTSTRAMVAPLEHAVRIFESEPNQNLCYAHGVAYGEKRRIETDAQFIDASLCFWWRC